MTTIQPDRMFFGAPASITVDGVDGGTTFDPPHITIEYETNADKTRPQGARSNIKGLLYVKTAICKAKFKVYEFASVKLGWVMPGATADSPASVGQVLAGLDTTLAADPALGATNLKVTSVTTVTVGQFVRVGAAGVAATEANSEVLRVLTVGTTGSGGTGLDVENSAGGGALLDHANADEVKTVNGTVLAAPAAAGATNIKVDSVSGLAIGDFIRIGYVDHYETRVLTAVGTGGVGGTGLTFAIPLTRDHALDEWAIEVTSLGGTTITWDLGRVDSSAYKDLVLTSIGADGRTLEVTLKDAMSAESQDLPFDDDPANPLGLALKFTGYVDPQTPRRVPLTWRFIDAA